MPQSQFESDVKMVVIRPALILFGMFVAGSFLDKFLHTTNTFSVVFTPIGGIPTAAL